MDFNAISTGQFERLARKTLAIKNAGVLNTLAPELGLSLDVPAGAELKAYLGERHFNWSHFVAAVAAQYSRFVIANISTDAIVVVNGVTIAATAAMGQWFLTLDSGALLGGLATQLAYSCDTRIRAGALADVGVYSGAAAAAPPTSGTANVIYWGYEAVAGQTQLNLVEPVVIGPGFKLYLECNTVNLGIFGGFSGYTRKLDPGELVP